MQKIINQTVPEFLLSQFDAGALHARSSNAPYFAHGTFLWISSLLIGAPVKCMQRARVFAAMVSAALACAPPHLHSPTWKGVCECENIFLCKQPSAAAAAARSVEPRRAGRHGDQAQTIVAGHPPGWGATRSSPISAGPAAAVGAHRSQQKAHVVCKNCVDWCRRVMRATQKHVGR